MKTFPNKMSNLLCKIFGHKRSVIWNTEELVGEYCIRCKTWTNKTHNGNPMRGYEMGATMTPTEQDKEQLEANQ